MVLFFIIGIALTVILEIFAGNIAEIMRRRKQKKTEENSLKRCIDMRCSIVYN
ncbi:hypothetical protein [[Clostridium] scindens]|uniref:hypothetical protein n=1 Tax=Clostridium scindens (strain JCM 10418 / VPI 12708) TaxID=29347 RepID=UPI002E789BB0|nr:hypothetical protein [[Clostridium] scindens]MEE0647670.1 hypothetical protein [[Clostridium] scindens]